MQLKICQWGVILKTSTLFDSIYHRENKEKKIQKGKKEKITAKNT